MCLHQAALDDVLQCLMQAHDECHYSYLPSQPATNDNVPGHGQTVGGWWLIYYGPSLWTQGHTSTIPLMILWPPLPMSILDWQIDVMKGGSLPGTLGTPMASLFRISNGTSNPYQLEDRQGSNRQGRAMVPARAPSTQHQCVHTRNEAARR